MTSKVEQARNKRALQLQQLPYDVTAGSVDAIIGGLAHALQTADPKAATYWSRALATQLQLKQPVPQPQLAAALSLLNQLLQLPTVELKWRCGWARTAAQVLKHSDSAQLDWRPLLLLMRDSLDTGAWMAYNSTEGMADRGPLYSMAKQARRHLSSGGHSEEIWQLILPMLVPGDDIAFLGSGLLRALLPPEPAEPPTAHTDLWAGRCLEHWQWIPNCLGWDVAWSCVLTRIVKHAAPSYDWSSHLPFVFHKLLQCIELPNGLKRSERTRCPSEFEWLAVGSRIQCMAKLIAYLIPSGDGYTDSSIRSHLERFLYITETFFHPSNNGAWSSLLVRFCNAVCHYLHRRQRRAESLVSASCLEQVQQAMLPGLQQMRLAKNPGVVLLASRALRSLMELSPGTALSGLIEGSLLPSLCGEAANSPHHVQSALVSLAYLVPLLMEPGWAGGLQHLRTILEVSLMGIDVNDQIKTNATLMLYQAVLCRLPLVDVSGDIGAISEMADWTIMLLERVFLYISLLDPPDKDLSGPVSLLGGMADSAGSLLNVVLQLLFAQMSASLPKKVSHHH